MKMMFKGGPLVLFLLFGVVVSFKLKYGIMEIDLPEPVVGWLDPDMCQSKSPSTSACCLTTHGHTGCVDIKYTSGGSGTLEITVTLDGHEVDKATVTGLKPDPPCFTFRGADVCVTIYNVKYTEKTFSGCVKVSVKAGFIHKFQNVGCFSLSAASTDSIFNLLFKPYSEKSGIQAL